MRKRHDPVAVVEAAYDVRAPEPIWVEHMLEAARPLLDDGCGMLGFVVDFNDPVAHARSPLGLGGTEEWQKHWRRDWWERFLLPLPRELLAKILAFAPVTFVSHAGRAIEADHDTLAQYLAHLGENGIAGEVIGHPVPSRSEPTGVHYPEALSVQAMDPSGHGVVLAASRATPSRRPPSRSESRAWTRVASHIAAAHRIRRRLHGGSPLEGADAIVAPGGKVVHADGLRDDPERLEVVRRAALDVDLARTEGVRGSDDALELWRALHDGRWSIVDTFDTDGRRFLIARANEPGSRPAPALSRREQQVLDLLALGHSNKLIAYDLGISVSSVATHLRRAAAKLSLRSTRDLVRWARARRRPEDADGAESPRTNE